VEKERIAPVGVFGFEDFMFLEKRCREPIEKEGGGKRQRGVGGGVFPH